jgi:uncharacterized integral membrane protein (TIGR00698 family)
VISVQDIRLSYGIYRKDVFALYQHARHNQSMDTKVLPMTKPSRLTLRGRQVLFLGAAALSLTPWASPASALALGMALALTHENPFAHIGKRTAKILLQGCVILLGFGMNLAVVLEAGAHGALLAAASIATTFALGGWLGRRLQINPKTSLLISAGTAICGGSAIAAVGTVTSAAEGEMTVAMGTVFLLNAVALYTFPLIGHALHLTQGQFGTWAGIAIHDISSVVGAASRYGLPALQTATAVKLSRALWIIPVALAAGRIYRPHGAHGTLSAARPEMPWFIGLFLLASVARTFLPGVAKFAPAMSHLAQVGLTLTLFLIGAGLSREILRAVGWKPMAQGILLWIFISVTSLWVILQTA